MGRRPGPPLDLSKDPDRFDPSAPPVPPGPLDRNLDPNRYRPPRPAGQGQTLEDLLGEGAHEGERDGYEWLLGLLAVVAFLALVAVVFSAIGS